MEAACERCIGLEREIAGARAELVSLGRNPTGHESLADNDLERELARWLTRTREPAPDAAFRAGWARLAYLVGPRIREWQALVQQANREGDQLRSRVGVLLREISRLGERG